ncbi:MAG: nucleotide-binding protein, partial [Acidobacteria bacterium]|nr:nucleotide-binding protein [Acidobacteriota bacterium]
MQQPRVFVGSSSEAEAIDQQVRLALERLGVTPVPWSSVVPPGEYLLDALLDMSMEVDGALLLATSDDQQEYRGVSRMTPRDNILLEAGIFLAVFGRQRAGIVRVAPEGQIDPALPSDLAGLNVIVLDPSKPERY